MKYFFIVINPFYCSGFSNVVAEASSFTKAIEKAEVRGHIVSVLEITRIDYIDMRKKQGIE